MRGADVQQGGLFSYVSMERRIPANHPLRAVRALLDEALASMSRDFDRVYAEGGQDSVPPERLVRALVQQVLYSIPSERLIEAKVAHNLLRRVARLTAPPPLLSTRGQCRCHEANESQRRPTERARLRGNAPNGTAVSPASSTIFAMNAQLVLSTRFSTAC